MSEPWAIDETAFPVDGSMEERAHFCLQYAVLAPSSHNTQPWRFRVDGNRIDIYLDSDRWLKIADPDRRELNISIGCALENLLIAAEHFGFQGSVAYLPDPAQADLAARVTLHHAPAMSFWRPPVLFSAITTRHTHHGNYDDVSLSGEVRQALTEMVSGPGLSLSIIDDSRKREGLNELMVEADARQFADPAWREELGYWLRQGVFGTGWLMSRMAALAVTYLNMGKGLARHDVDRANHAACFGCLLLETVSPEAQLRTGQAFERLFLMATHHGVRLQPMNQVLQVYELRERFAKLIEVDPAAPQILFRLGYASPEDHTPRRPLDEVLRP